MKKFKAILLFTTALNYFTHGQDYWENLPLPDEFYGRVSVLYHDNVENSIWVGGAITHADSSNPVYNFLLKYDGTNWKHYGPFFGVNIFDICRFQDKIVFCGTFDNYNAIYGDIPNPYRYIAFIRADTVGYFDDLNIVAGLNRLKVIDDQLYCVGWVDSIFGMAVNNAVKFDGTVWSTVHGFPQLIEFYDPDYEYNYDLTVLYAIEEYNGVIHMGGQFACPDYFGTEYGNNGNIANFNGTDWELTGGGQLSGGIVESVNCLKVFQNELYAAGSISKPAGNAGNSIQKWNGTTWSSVGGDLGGYNNEMGDFTPVYDLEVYNNELYIAGNFEYAGGIPAGSIVKWDGEKYCTFGPRFFEGTRSLTFLNDTLYVHGLYLEGNDSQVGIFKYIGGENQTECSTVDLKENDALLQLDIYPSPAENEINIYLPKENSNSLELEIYNLLGQKVQAKKENFIENKKILLPIYDYSKGQYNILIKEKGIVIANGKFIKN